MVRRIGQPVGSDAIVRCFSFGAIGIPLPRNRGVQRNAIRPRTELSALIVIRQTSPNLQQDLLNQILGVASSVDARDATYPIAVLFHNRTKALFEKRSIVPAHNLSESPSAGRCYIAAGRFRDQCELHQRAKSGCGSSLASTQYFQAWMTESNLGLSAAVQLKRDDAAFFTVRVLEINAAVSI